MAITEAQSFHYFTYQRFLRFMSVIFMTVMVILMVRMDGALDVISNTEKDGLTEVLNNRVVSCRILIALRQEVLSGGPCAEDSVRKQIAVAQKGIVPIGSAADHHETQLLVCQLMRDIDPKTATPFCLEILK